MDSHAYKVLHNVPTTMEATAEQNFLRGQIAVLEDLLGLKQELAEWKASHK